MFFKLVVLSALLVAVNAGYLAQVPTHYSTGPAVLAKVANPALDAVATTHQNVVRSFGGTVSQYSKSVQTPYSSVHKEDTRINNNVYTPTIAKTVAYAAPAVAKTVSYAPVPTAGIYTAHSAPVETKALYAHQQPTHAVYASYAPAKVYANEQPAHSVHVASEPSAAVFAHQHETHSAPVVTKTLYAQQQPTHSVYASYAPEKVYTNEHPAHSVHIAAAPTAAVFAHQHESHSAPVVTKTLYAQQQPTHAVYASYAPQKVYTNEQPAHSVLVAPSPTPAVFGHQNEVPSTATTTYNHGPAATTYSHNSPAVSAYGSRQTVHYSPAETVSHMSFDGFGTHWGF